MDSLCMSHNKIGYTRLCEEQFQGGKFLEKCLMKCKLKVVKKFVNNLTRFEREQQEQTYIGRYFQQIVDIGTMSADYFIAGKIADFILYIYILYTFENKKKTGKTYI